MDSYQGGGCYFEWMADEREIWRQINAMDPLDKLDLQNDALRLSRRQLRLDLLKNLENLDDEGVREIARREIESIDGDLDEHERYKAEAREVFRRSLESGSPDEWIRWVLGQPFFRPISPDDPTDQGRPD